MYYLSVKKKLSMHQENHKCLKQASLTFTRALYKGKNEQVISQFTSP
jgi:hypothetical protein